MMTMKMIFGTIRKYILLVVDIFGVFRGRDVCESLRCCYSLADQWHIAL